MKINYIYSSFLLVLFGLYGCAGNPDTPAEYFAWFGQEENGFIKTRSINGIEYTVHFRPVELQILRELDQTSLTVSPAFLDSLKASYGKSLNFILEIGLADGDGKVLANAAHIHENPLQVLQELSFSMQEQVELEVGENTYVPSLFHFERGYELGKKERFLFSFPVPEKDMDKPFIFRYEDKFFGGSLLNFSFDVTDKNIPPLPVKVKS